MIALSKAGFEFSKSDMLAIVVAVFAIAWALWFAYTLRYPGKWDAMVDRQHLLLSRWGLSVSWMNAAEKGLLLKALVGTTALVLLACLAILLQHPDAFRVFISESWAT